SSAAVSGAYAVVDSTSGTTGSVANDIDLAVVSGTGGGGGIALTIAVGGDATNVMVAGAGGASGAGGAATGGAGGAGAAGGAAAGGGGGGGGTGGAGGAGGTAAEGSLVGNLGSSTFGGGTIDE